MKRKIETPLIHTTKHKPWGNYMIDAVSGIKEIRTPGLGLFSKLSDAFLIDFFQSYILFPLKYTSLNSIKEFKQNLNTLIVLMRCSKAFYAYTTHDAFFRDITIQYFGGNFHFLDSWRNTFISSFCKLTSITFTPYPLIEINHLYSDYLFQSFHGGSVDINVLCDVLMDENGDIDVSRDSIPRRALLSMDSFNSEFANLNLPVIITDIVDKWIAYKKWNMKSMVDRFANVVFRAESLDTTMKNYCSYSNKIESRQVLDESPLYLFDKKFVESCPELGQEYAVPEYFQQDLFGLMKDKRPDYRWIIIGPERSGSTFHVDPNSTSAWNAVITGAKKWILFPPGLIPPGVYVNQDKSEVTAPQTLSEWYIHYYKQVKSICKESQNMVAHKRPVVGVCRAGEVIFVPSGWWHCVMNISESIAITQNFVDDYNLANVLKFIRDKKDQVSGVDKPEELYDSFGKLLKHRMPEVIDRMMAREVENGREFSWEKKAKNSGIWDSVNGTKVDSGFQFKF